MTKITTLISTAVSAILASVTAAATNLVKVAPVQSLEQEAEAFVARVEAEAAASYKKADAFRQAAWDLLAHAGDHDGAARDKTNLSNRLKRVL